MLLVQVPPMPAAQAREVIERELGVPLEAVFEWIDLDEPLGSASISQVWQHWTCSTVSYPASCLCCSFGCGTTGCAPGAGSSFCICTATSALHTMPHRLISLQCLPLRCTRASCGTLGGEKGGPSFGPCGIACGAATPRPTSRPAGEPSAQRMQRSTTAEACNHCC